MTVEPSPLDQGPRTSSIIDVDFDVRSDTPSGRDPDQHSPTLREYHRVLWSKPLPSGQHFGLDTSHPRRYLHHRSEIGEFHLASDRIGQSFAGWRSLTELTSQFTAEDNEAFRAQSNAVTGVIVWPGNTVDRKPTINGARGMNRRIADRLDPTVECVRRHYAGEVSPLSEALKRYADFFELFGSFRGYIEFFLLQDLIDESEAVQFFTDFDGFSRSGVPADQQAYAEYRRSLVAFLAARRQRIQDWLHAQLAGN